MTVKSFFDSSTIRAGLKIKNKTNLKSSLIVASSALAPVLLSEIGINGLLNDTLTSAVNGAISGETIESILLTSATILLTRSLDKKNNEKIAKEVIKGRIKADNFIEKSTIPREYQI